MLFAPRDARFFSVYICCCVIALQLESSSSKKNRSKKTRRANARCSLPRERERERTKERGKTKTEEAPLLRVLRVVRVDTNVFDEKIVECIFVCYYYIPRLFGWGYGVPRSTFPYYFFLNKPLTMEKSGALCTTAS